MTAPSNFETNYELQRLHEPQELYRLGSITEVNNVSHNKYGIADELKPAAVYEVVVDDPYIREADQEVLSQISEYEQFLDNFTRERREAGAWQREAGTAYIDGEGNSASKSIDEWGDPVARKLGFDEVGSDALRAWRTKIPSAAALGDLSEPYAKSTMVDINGNEVPMDDIARHWLAGCTDARAIRNRGTVMAEIVKSYVAETGDSNPNWMSVACGTALPAMKAANFAGISPHLRLVDWDTRAMDVTEELAQEINFGGMLTKHVTNIFSNQEIANLRETLGTNGDRPKILDLMGIFEYTGKHIGVDPAEFLRANYDMLAPGGVLVFGQMREDRPCHDFTMGVIGWPYIVMRTPKEVMEVVSNAGIEASSAQLYLPQDGVYTICAIHKPEGQESFAAAA